MSLNAGELIGPYEIIALLGLGGMGEVYRARDTRLRRNVALKILPESFAKDPSRVKRFEEEARAASALHHPNIVTLFDVGRNGSNAYIVSELVEGETLRAMIGRGPVSPRRTVEIAAQICDGLAAAHAASIVHRDLKPENIMLSNEGRVKILDFGLAKQTLPSGLDEEVTTATIETAPGIVLGTLGYMSPEQVRAGTVDTRSDIFSLGVIVYELLTAKRVFSGPSTIEILHAILNEDPPTINARVGPALDRIVRRCLDKDPRRRFQSAADLGFALASTLTPPADVAGESATYGKWPILLGIGVGFVVLAILTVFWMVPRRDPEFANFTQLVGTEGTVSTAHFYKEMPLYAFTSSAGQQHVYLLEPSGAAREIVIPSGTRIASVSSKGQIALLASVPSGDNPFSSQARSTLTELPLSGGTPRPILEDISCAQWSPDGSAMAVIRYVGKRSRLEYPIGNVLLTTNIQLISCRISPDGQKVAFIHNRKGFDTMLEVVDRYGSVRSLIRVAGFTSRVCDPFWSPDGKEIWYSSFEPHEPGTIYAVDMKGRRRVLGRFPGAVQLLDVAANGKMLLKRTVSFATVEMDRERAPIKDLSWAHTIAYSMTSDGSHISMLDFETQGREFFVRNTDGSAPVRFERGAPAMLSPDGNWVAVARGPDAAGRFITVFIPTGPGESIEFQPKGFTDATFAGWLADSKHFLFGANRRGETWIQFQSSLDDLTPHELPATAQAPTLNVLRIASPDNDSFVYTSPDGKRWVYSISGKPPKLIPNLARSDSIMNWTQDGKAVFVSTTESESNAMRIYRVDVTTGARRFWHEIRPSKRDARIYRALITPMGTTRVYSYYHGTSDLWMVEGLK